MARVNKLYEKPLVTSIGLSDKVTVGQLVDGEYKVKTMLYSTFLAQIIDDTLVLIVTRAQLQALIAGSSLGIGVRYIITNAVSSTLSLLIQAVSTTVLDEIAVNTADGENYKYNIVSDTAILISNPIALGTSNQVLGVNNGATAQEYKTVQGTTDRVSVNHTANTITITTPQDIATTSNVEFAKLNLNNTIPIEDEFSIVGKAMNDDIGTVDNVYFISALDLLTNAVAESTYLTTIDGISAGGELQGTYANPTLLNSAVVGKVLTGLSVSGSAVLSTDSILTGIGKLQNQVNALVGGVKYQGSWNASTNNPALTSSVGTAGYYYVVSVPGSTNLNGITSWELGDWAIFNGSTWQKVDNTDAVVSVNGYTGIVTLSASDIGAVPYTGATTNVDLGTHSLTASDLVINHASGSGVAASITKGGNGEALTVVKSSGSGNAASITGGTTLISTLSVTGDGVVTGNLTVDTNTFFVDATNNRVGIGTASPLSGLMHFYAATGGATVRFSEAATTVGFVGSANGLVTGKNGSFMVRGESGLVLSGQGNNSSMFIDSTGDIQTKSATDTGEHFIIGGSGRINGTATITGAVTGSSTAQFTKLGLGNAPSATSFIFSNVNPTGGTSISAWRGIFSASNDVTSRLNGVSIAVGTQASTTISDIVVYNAEGTSFGAGSSATRVTGFSADSTLANALATNVYGFQGSIASGTNRWNLYMSGTAVNYLNGNLQLGSTTATAGAEKLQVTGTASISGALSIGNTVASAVAVASTHKVTIVIGGVTYYLLATNV